jgi:hypothetical protein
MGRTIPSFRIALGMEEADWKPFRNALDKKDRKKFDDMFDIPRSYISACTYSVQYVRFHPILMSILFHHYKQLTECIAQVEHIENRVKEREPLLRIQPSQEQIKQEEPHQQEEGEEYVANTGTLDRYFLLPIRERSNCNSCLP